MHLFIYLWFLIDLTQARQGQPKARRPLNAQVWSYYRLDLKLLVIKLVIETLNSYLPCLLSNKWSESSHFPIDNRRSYCYQRSRPLLAIRTNASLRPFRFWEMPENLMWNILMKLYFYITLYITTSIITMNKCVYADKCFS